MLVTRIRQLAVLLLALLPFHGVVLASGGGKSNSTGPYLAMEPFVVNVKDGTRPRFLQVNLQLMSSTPEVLDVLQTNTPALRDALIMLLAHQDVEVVQTMEGREALRQQVLAAAQAVLIQFSGAASTSPVPSVEAVYFTDFIIQ